MAETTPQKKRNQWPRQAKGGGKKSCMICKRPYRAKGYCFFHYKKWRQGDLPHSRYRTCSKPDCRIKVVRGGFCAKHYDETYKAAAVPTEAAPAAAATPAPAAAPAPAAPPTPAETT